MQNSINQSKPTISRRSFMALAGLTGTCAMLAGCSPSSGSGSGSASSGAPEKDYVWSCCHVNCGSRCPLKAYVKEGTIVRIGVDDEGSDVFGPGEIQQLRSCVRGRTNRQRVFCHKRNGHHARDAVKQGDTQQQHEFPSP